MLFASYKRNYKKISLIGYDRWVAHVTQWLTEIITQPGCRWLVVGVLTVFCALLLVAGPSQALVAISPVNSNLNERAEAVQVAYKLSYPSPQALVKAPYLLDKISNNKRQRPVDPASRCTNHPFFLFAPQAFRGPEVLSSKFKTPISLTTPFLSNPPFLSVASFRVVANTTDNADCGGITPHLDSSLTINIATVLPIPGLLGQLVAANSLTRAVGTGVILVVGDSLSAAYGLNPNQGWVALLQKRLRKDNQAFKVVNASISGDTSLNGLARLPQALEQHQPQIVILELGANDGLQGRPVASIRRNLTQLIKLSQQAGAEVLLLGMRLPPNYGRGYTEPFFAMYAELAKQLNTAYAPFFLEEVGGRPEYFQADRLHPNADAQALMLDYLWPYLQPLLK